MRYSNGTLPTDYTFTAQREDLGGLMDYRARYYDPALNRFIQADTIVPEPGNSQAYNRYMFVKGNPLRYVDPSGHWADCPGSAYGGNCPTEQGGDVDRIKRVHSYGRRIGPDKSLSSFNRFIAFLDYAAGLYDLTDSSEVDEFMMDVSEVIHGHEYRQSQSVCNGYFDCTYSLHYSNNWSSFWLGYGAFDPAHYTNGGSHPDADAGWSKEYRDDSGNQAYHFWFYVASSYFDNPAVSWGANALHDGGATPIGSKIQPQWNEFVAENFEGRMEAALTMPPYSSKADYDLGVKGREYGTLLRYSGDVSGVHPYDITTWLNLNLGGN